MSIKDFWQNAIKYRLAGGHAADHAAMGVPAIGRRAPVRGATFGDSTANTSTPSPDTQDMQVLTAPFPASGSTVFYSFTEKWPVQMFYPQAYLVGNFGISGQTTTQMLARDTAAASTTRRATADVVNVSPDFVILRGGSINNLTPITPATYDSVVATCYAEHCQIIQRLLMGTGVVIDEGIFGYSGAATYAPQVRQALLQLNAMFKAYAAQYPGRVYFLDSSSKLMQADGNYVASKTIDGTHLNSTGAYDLGQLEAALLTQIFGASSVGPRYKGVNLVTNPAMTPTTTDSKGTYPTGWAWGGVNCTPNGAQVEIIDGEPWATCLFTITAANNTGYIAVPFNPSTVAANDIIGGEYKWGVWPQGGVPFTPYTFQGRVDWLKTGAGHISINDNVAAYGQMPAGGMSGRKIFNPFKCPEPGANLQVDSLYFQFGAVEAAGTFKIGVAAPRLIDLGQSFSTGAS